MKDEVAEERGTVFVISAPSGCGKTTLCEMLIERMDRISFSVSHTTREPRVDEEDGRDYFFVDKERFRTMIKKEEFLEWAQVFSHYYGTSGEKVFEKISAGKDVILDIDQQGAVQVRERLGERVTLIMLVPPELETLKERLISREGEKADVLERLKKVDLVLNKYEYFDYLIVNDKLEDAFNDLTTVIKAQRLNMKRNSYIVKRLLNDFNKEKK